MSHRVDTFVKPVQQEAREAISLRFRTEKTLSSDWQTLSTSVTLTALAAPSNCVLPGRSSPQLRPRSFWSRLEFQESGRQRPDVLFRLDLECGQKLF